MVEPGVLGDAGADGMKWTQGVRTMNSPKTWRWMGILLLALFGGGQAWAQTVEYIHTDALGSPVAVTDANGNVIERTVYEPYGAQVNRAVMDGPGYTGHVSDAATGLSYMQQRYYDPEIPRFLSVDPVTAYSNPVGAFNRYWYANNNPYGFIDPDGRQACGKSTTCRIRQGERGGVVGGIGGRGRQERNPNSPATQAIANKAASEANSRLEGVASKSHKTPGAAARAWANAVQPVSIKYNTEILSNIFSNGSGGAVLGNAVSDGLINSVTISTANLSVSPLGPNYPAIGYVHSHPENTMLSSNDRWRALDMSLDINKYRSSPIYPQAFVSRPDGRVFGWSVEDYAKDTGAYENPVYREY